MLLWCLLPPRAKSKAVQVWLWRDKGRGEEEEGRGEEVEKGAGGGQRYSSQPRSSIRRVMRSCHSHGRMRTYRPKIGGSKMFFL